MSHTKKVIIIGSGIGGLSLSALLSKKGYDVSVFEKNDSIGGRARIYKADGFTFDMGPSWYMMPDVIEDFFSLLGENISDYFTLTKLAPSYRIFSEHAHTYDIYADRQRLGTLFDSVEPNSQLKLYEYLDESKRQYEIAKREFMYKNYDSLFDLFNKRILTEGRKIQMFTSMKSLIEKLFSHPMLRKILQFQTVLLGTDPSKTPGLYRLMNYVDFDLGIWYPHGGISKLPESLSSIASKHGTNIYTNSPVRKIIVTDDGRATGVELEDGTVHTADIVVSNADIHFTEQKLLDEKWRDHSEKYWESKTLAPSAFIMYIGTSKQFPSLTHHNLLFTKDWNKNFKEVFGGTTFPSDPSLYVCTPSKTDDTVAPQGKENIFVLVPISPYVAYTDTDLEQWKEYTLEKMEKEMGMSGLRESIEHMRIYCTKDFAHDYNSFKGSALGLAHTLTQTAFFRANNVSQKVQNLYFVGAGTNPGIGMPICMISAEMAYKRIEGITDPEPLKSL